MKNGIRNTLLLGAIAGAFAASAKQALDLNERVVGAIKREAPPSFFQEIGFRHKEALVLGSTKAWQFLDSLSEDSPLYPLATYRCSKWEQYSLLRCYFGHVSTGGKVVVIIDPSEKMAEKEIRPLDMKLIHPLLFRAEGGGLSKKQIDYPLFYFPFWSIDFLRKIKMKESRGDSSDSELVDDYIPDDYLLDAQYIGKIREFCEERGLKLALLFLGSENGNVKRQCSELEIDTIDFCKCLGKLNDSVLTLLAC